MTSLCCGGHLGFPSLLVAAAFATSVAAGAVGLESFFLATIRAFHAIARTSRRHLFLGQLFATRGGSYGGWRGGFDEGGEALTQLCAELVALAAE